MEDLHNIDQGSNKLQALVIVPTRELASQVTESLQPTATALSIKTVTLTGGANANEQQQQLSTAPQLAIATPGRLLALIKSGELELAQCTSLVLDEADRLIDMGFWPDIQAITAALPTERQSLLFSATLPPELVSQAETLLSNPEKITTHKENSVVETIEETLYLVNKGSKAMFVTIGNMVIQLPFLFIMPKLLGVTGIWIAFPLSNIALSLVVMTMLWRDTGH